MLSVQQSTEMQTYDKLVTDLQKKKKKKKTDFQNATYWQWSKEVLK